MVGEGGGARPVVAVVYTVPLLCEALTAVLEDIAELRSFPARGGDMPGLLGSLHPDAVVVDTQEEASAAVPYARDAHATLIHVLLRERRLRVLRAEGWEELGGGEASPEGIRNVLVGGIFGKQEVA